MCRRIRKSFGVIHYCPGRAIRSIAGFSQFWSPFGDLFEELSPSQVRYALFEVALDFLIAHLLHLACSRRCSILEKLLCLASRKSSRFHQLLHKVSYLFRLHAVTREES